MYRMLTRTLPPAIIGLLLIPYAEAQDGDWRPLFNGKDLTGWDTWLGVPFGKNGKDSILGLNKDPSRVFTVVEVEGKPAIRISGETYGAITTKDEFDDYHLKLEFKWGDKKWPPRDQDKRDSGLIYRCVGPHGALLNAWMRGLQLQIQEGGVGDYWSVAGAIADVEGERKDANAPIQFKKGGTKYSVQTKGTGIRVTGSIDNEKKAGEWNTIELFVSGQTSVHVINGKANMVLAGARQIVDGKEVPLTKGKIQIQSEGSEVFYRNIALRKIEKIPGEYYP